MQQVQYINGNLIGTLSAAVSIKGDTTVRDGAMWFDIEPTLQDPLTIKAQIKDEGYSAANGQYILYPTVMQSKDGNVEMAFSITSSTTNPSAAYAVVGDQTQTQGKNTSTIYVATTGDAPYNEV